MVTRREMLTQLGLIGGSALVGATLSQASRSRQFTPAPLPETQGLALPGRLYAAGFGAKLSSGQGEGGRSVLTEIQLQDHRIQQTWIDLANAHSVIPLATRELLVLPLDGTEAAIARPGIQSVIKLACPHGYLYSGHGVCSANGKIAYVSLRKSAATKPTDTGRIGVLDLASHRLTALLDSGGVRPHDLAWLDGGTRLAISHYGDINYETAGKTNNNAREPRLTVLELSTGKILQDIAAPASGSLTHIAVGSQGTICGVPLNYFGLDNAGKSAVEHSLGGRGFEISVAEEREGRIAEPMPIYLFSLGGNKLESLAGTAAKQRRAQSVAYHPVADSFFATYTFSDELAVIRESEIRYVSAFSLGLNYLRGVCPVGSTNLLAVSGGIRGVTLLNAQDLTVAERIDVSLFDSPHIVWTA